MSLLSRTAGLIYTAVIRAASMGPVRTAARAVFAAFTPERDIKISFPGYSVYARTTDRLIAALLCKYSMPDSLESAVYRSRIRPGMTVAEVGANLGFYTFLLSDLVGSEGSVLAIEPDPENFRLLEKSAAENGRRNITCKKAAASDSSGTLKLYLSEENRGDHRVYDGGEGRAWVEVQALALDDEIGPGKKVDFIKMDIQGAEYPALLGMERTIRNSPGLAMLCEFTPGLIKKAGHSPEKLLRKLMEFGFTLRYLDEASHSVRDTSPEELLALCPGEKYVNLLLDKHPGTGVVK